MQKNNKSVVGIFFSLLIPLIYVFFLSPFILIDRVEDNTILFIGFAIMWLSALFVLFFVLFVEKRTLKSIGFKRISGKMVLLAIGLGIILSLFVPVITLLLSKILSVVNDGSIQEVISSRSWWILLISVITAGVCEEIIFRGYLIERLSEIFNQKKDFLVLFISLFFFVLFHLSSWNYLHILGVVLPLGIVLNVLYIRKRNLVFNIIVHIMIDLPLVIMALMQ